MRITVYEVREDEKLELEKVAKENNILLDITSKELNEATFDLAKGSNAISILGKSKLTPEILNKCKEENINYISTRTIGFNHIDLEHAKSLGIKICNSNYAPNGVSDYTIMLMLLTLRHYKPAMWRSYVNDYSLSGLQGKEMKDLTIGIMGTGRIGETVIESLKGFGCKILAYDVHENEKVKQTAEYVDLETFYRESDMISLHMPLLESTYHVINKDTIKKMKEGVIIINCARGELLDIPDTIEGIESKKIGALGLDVFENEDGIYHQDLRSDIIANRDMAYLRQFPNVIMTQHMAFYTDAAVKSMVDCGIKGIIEMNKEGKTSTQIV